MWLVCEPSNLPNPRMKLISRSRSTPETLRRDQIWASLSHSEISSWDGLVEEFLKSNDFWKWVSFAGLAWSRELTVMWSVGNRQGVIGEGSVSLGSLQNPHKKSNPSSGTLFPLCSERKLFDGRIVSTGCFYRLQTVEWQYFHSNRFVSRLSGSFGSSRARCPDPATLPRRA